MSVILIVVSGISGGTSHARQGGPITLTGTLTPARPQSQVDIRVAAGEAVTITLVSGDFDPVLTILDRAGEIITENDDHPAEIPLPNRRDSAVTFTPVRNQTLVARVTSFTPGETGSYTLTLQGAEVVGQALPMASPDTRNIVQGTLTAEAPQEEYLFRAPDGQTITITASSGDFDTVLEVRDETGAQIASNDDHFNPDGDADPEIPLPRSTDSAVVFEAPHSGIYTAVVSSFVPEEGGRFTVTIDGAQFGLGSAPPDASVCDDVIGSVAAVSSFFGSDFAADRLLDSDPATGWSSRGDDAAPYIIFAVSGSEPITLNGVVFNGYAASPDFPDNSVREFEIAVSTTGVDLATFTTILNAAAPQENDLRPYSFDPVSARYVMLRPVSNYGGSYFEAAEFNACTTLSSGELRGDPPYTVNGALSPGLPYLEYQLYAADGAEVTATLVSAAFNPVLEIYAADGTRLADNDDHAPEFPLPSIQDAAVRLVLANGGMIAVRVRSFAGGGPFILTIDGTGLSTSAPSAESSLPECRDVSSAAEGGSIVGFSSEFGGRWLAASLIDGSADTGWASGADSNHTRNEYIILDLAGDTWTIDGVQINPAATGGDSDISNTSSFAVLVASADPQKPESFVEVFATPLQERYNGMLAFSFEPVEARYVMLQTRDNFGASWHSVAEFTVCAAEE